MYRCTTLKSPVTRQISEPIFLKPKSIKQGNNRYSTVSCQWYLQFSHSTCTLYKLVNFKSNYSVNDYNFSPGFKNSKFSSMLVVFCHMSLWLWQFFNIVYIRLYTSSKPRLSILLSLASAFQYLVKIHLDPWPLAKHYAIRVRGEIGQYISYPLLTEEPWSICWATCGRIYCAVREFR